MSWERWVIIGFLAFEVFKGLYKEGKLSATQSTPETVGGIIGHLLRWGCVAGVLYSGGFFS